MLYFDDLKAAPLPPKLIPTFKQPERQLLSVFFALMEGSKAFRTRFLAACGYKAGKTASFMSAMEPQYEKAKYPEVRPDGLLSCKRGSSHWAAFVEAKCDKNPIRSEQIQNYLELAKMLSVDTVISISNEFARLPEDPPYFIARKFTKTVKLLHFAWADVRTMLNFTLAEEFDLEHSERFLLQQGAEFFWTDKSGISTYDAMPENWKAFVEASGTSLGFGQNQKGLAEIVHGWQQERRDLASKLANQTMQAIDLRHHSGVRLDDEGRLKADRKLLADDYRLGALYLLKDSKTEVDVLVSLRSCRIEVAFGISLPEGKGARACISWLSKQLKSAGMGDAILSIDWPGHAEDSTLTVEDFINDPDGVLAGQKSAPKSAKLIFGHQDTRRFKSRKFFIADLENLILSSLSRTMGAGFS